MAQLKQDMGTLEKTMSSEIKRRLEMSKSFQSVSAPATRPAAPAPYALCDAATGAAARGME